ncbi:MAG: DUF1194 domain-containing protein [Rhodospirillaceae bacterium]|nr:DUF1194 domain-containing protein [Rhodospirillaceae bacterium]
MRAFLGLLLGALLAAAPARADGPEAVDLELVLAIDVSGSVDEEEAALQRHGYLRALLHPQVLQAITGGERRKIGVTYVEWAGYHYQRVVADWSLISDKASAEAFVAKIRAVPVSTERWTSISGAIEYSMKRFAVSPFRGTRRVIDISGDGRNNNGRELAEVRAEALAKNIVINGLPIVNDRPTRWGTPPERDLDLYYRDQVIGGPGSFYIVAKGFEDFANAIRTKLVREISGRPGDGADRAAAPGRPSVR